MMQTKSICRVCSSRGDYDIFSVIPAYLHASPNEFLHWKKDISKLLEETTGLTVDPNDGLPQKMCALCISYLKHAATFRQQAIDNILSLKAAQVDVPKQSLKSFPDESIKSDKQNVCITADDLIFSETRKTDTSNLVNNTLNNFNNNKDDDYVKKFLLLNENNATIQNNAKEQEVSNLKTYLNLLFDKGLTRSPKGTRRNRQAGQSRAKSVELKRKISEDSCIENSDPTGDDFQTGSSDDNETFEKKLNIFSYEEKNFEEDDVMDLDVLKDANIIINIPEHCKERKCRACFRRFMFEDSYKEHMNTCVEYKFLIMIEELNRLLEIRRGKAISPHEFIRRVIFCLKKVCKWLSYSCGETLLPDLLINGEQKRRTKSDCKSSGAENSSGDNKTPALQQIFNNFAQNAKSPCNVPAEKGSLLNLLREKADPSLIRCENITPDPLLERLKTGTTPVPRTKKKLDSTSSDSSIACSIIEQNLKLNNDFSNPPKIDNGRKSLLKSFNEVASSATTQIARPLALPAHSVGTTFPVFYPKPNFSARCNACNTAFESIVALEEHNAKYHNNPTNKEERDRIIALFEGDGPHNLEGTVDVITLINTVSTSKPSSSAPPKKTIKCQICDQKFSTIVHLDVHKLKCHTTTSKQIVA